MINRLVLAILKVPSKEVAELFKQAISAMIASHISQTQLVNSWMVQSLMLVPVSVFTSEDKQILINLVFEPQDFRQSELNHRLDLL